MIKRRKIGTDQIGITDEYDEKTDYSGSGKHNCYHNGARACVRMKLDIQILQLFSKNSMNLLKLA
jgi:hypothetical protein